MTKNSDPKLREEIENIKNMKEHEENLKEMIEREGTQLNIVLFNVPESEKEDWKRRKRMIWSF